MAPRRQVPRQALLRCVVRLLERTRSSGRRQRPHPGRAHDEHRGRPGHLRSHPLNGGRNAARLATTYDFNIVIGAATPTSSRANCRRALSQQTSSSLKWRESDPGPWPWPGSGRLLRAAASSRGDEESFQGSHLDETGRKCRQRWIDGHEGISLQSGDRQTFGRAEALQVEFTSDAPRRATRHSIPEQSHL